MNVLEILIERVGYSVIQDLGRPGRGNLGISENGAGDQGAARLANALVGNAEHFPLIEVIASELAFTAQTTLLIAVTGAANKVLIDDQPHNTYETLVISAGSAVKILAPEHGQRAYLSINGQIQVEKILDSAAPDSFLEFGQRLFSGSKILIQSQITDSIFGNELPIFRFPVIRPNFTHVVNLKATIGPDLNRLKDGATSFDQQFEVLPQSDHVGMRLTGSNLDLVEADEILSRGVPIGAVEVPPSGELIILLRGRLVTAGYPVVAVLSKDSIDRASQAKAGDLISISLIDLKQAQSEIQAKDDEFQEIKKRVTNAFSSRGLEKLLSL